MARRGATSFGTLTPFGGSGSDFSAFDIIDTGREAYLAFTKVQIAWEDGQATNDEYLAALEKYAAALEVNSSERLNAEQRVRETKYRFARDLILKQVDDGEKTLADLVAFDAEHIKGMNPNSSGYADGLDLLQSSQSALFAEQEQDIVERYNDGLVTTQALSTWYKNQLNDALWANNPDLKDRIVTRIDDLSDRLSDEKDSQMISDYSDGRVSGAAFLAYATAALARYTPGTQQYREWTDRIEAARDTESETGLMYRYGLSQEYIQLQMFVANNQAPAGGTSTSTTTRTILGADGKWRTVEQKTTKATAPSAAEQAAWRDRQIEVNSAKARMAEISKQLAANGGFVTSQAAVAYYQKRQTRYTKGSADWYQLQDKIDGLNDRIRQEAVWKQQGYKVGYSSGGSAGSRPGSGGGSAGGGGGGGASAAAPSIAPSSLSDIDRFMAGLAKQESGGRYDARNASSGAYGKYQIMPANWSGWAAKYLGDASAPMSPANQEKVAKGKIADLYKWLGSWEAVAHWWLNGGSNKAWHNDPSSWSASGSRYVNNVMSFMGRASVPTGSGGAAPGSTSRSTAGTSRPSSAPSQARAYSATDVIVGTQQMGPKKGGTKQDTSLTVTYTKKGGFPINMSSQAFEDFYNGYSAAWEQGLESWTDPYSGVSYYIGLNPDQRITRMAELDKLRVDLYTEQTNAHAGTPSGTNAADKRRGAIEDAAGHAYMILDFDAAGATSKKNARANAPVASATNALGAAIAELDTVKAGIADEYRLAREAWDAGDVTAAYHHYQNAEQMVDQGIGPVEQIVAQRIAEVQGAYGVSPDQASLDETFGKDWTRLQGHEQELEKLQADNADLGAEMEPVIINPKTGQPNILSAGGVPYIRINDGFATLVSWDTAGNPKVEYQRIQAGGYISPDGTLGQEVKGYVRVQAVNTGTKVLDANENVMVKYDVERVGYIVGPGGQYLPIEGKIIHGPNGQVWVENPLDPGKWSNKMLVIDGGDKLEVTTNPKTGALGYGWYDNDTGQYIQLTPGDDGVYDLWGSRDGENYQNLGNVGSNPSLSAIIDRVGLRPQTTSDPFSYTNGAILGMDQKQYTAWANRAADYWKVVQKQTTAISPTGQRIGLSSSGAKVAGRVDIGTPSDPLARDKWWEPSPAGGAKVDLFSRDQNARDRWYLDQKEKTDKYTIAHEDQLRRVGELPPIPRIQPLPTQTKVTPSVQATKTATAQGGGRTGTTKSTALSKTGSGAKQAGATKPKPKPKPTPAPISPVKSTPV